MPNKHAPKKEVAAAASAIVGETEHVYTLPLLGTRLGRATEEEVNVYIEGFDKAALTEQGTRIGTSKIDTDTARMYGIAADFFAEASEAQLDLLPGVSTDMLRVAVWAANHGSERAKTREQQAATRGTSKVLRATAAEETQADAAKRRKVLKTSLEALAAGNATWQQHIQAANSTAGNTKSLDQVLVALVEVGRKMFKNPTPSMKTRLAKSRVDAAMLARIEKLAGDLKLAGSTAQAVGTVGGVSQAEVDYWDGVNLHFVGTLMDAFDAAHEVDPTIPRLLPITLRGYFGRLRGATGGSSGDPKVPATAPEGAKVPANTPANPA